MLHIKLDRFNYKWRYLLLQTFVDFGTCKAQNTLSWENRVEWVYRVKWLSHRKFLSQKGQSLAANIKGKQYMESTCDRLLSASRTDASFQSPWNPTATKIIRKFGSLRFTTAFHRGRRDECEDRSGHLYLLYSCSAERTEVMTPRPTCAWAFKCCSFKAFHTTHAKRSF